MFMCLKIVLKIILTKPVFHYHFIEYFPFRILGNTKVTKNTCNAKYAIYSTKILRLKY